MRPPIPRNAPVTPRRARHGLPKPCAWIDAENYANVRCDYTFLVERQRTETLEVLGSVTIPPHYYLDIQWEAYEEVGPPKRPRRRPLTAKLHRLYDGGDFTPLTATS